VGWGIAVVEAHRAFAAGPLLGCQYLLTFVGVGGHGLFGEDIAAQIHGAADILMVVAVAGGDNHRVRLAFRDHAVERFGGIGLDLNVPIFQLSYSPGNSTGVVVADPQQFTIIFEFHGN